MLEEVYQKTLSKVIAYLSYRQRSVWEVKQRISRYLKSQKALSQESREQIATQVLNYLEENKLLDDENFAKLFIESKTKGKNALGKRGVLAKLAQKGINKDLAEKLIENSFSYQDELTAAVEVLRRKFKGFSDNCCRGDILGFSNSLARPKQTDIATAQIRSRLEKYLVGRGFSYDVSHSAVDYFLNHP